MRLRARAPHFEKIGADDLAALAREGLSETIIRAMMNPLKPRPVEEAVKFLEPVPAGKAEPARKSKAKAPPKVSQPTPVELAMASHTPYYESSSSLFGLSKKQIGVGEAAGEGHRASSELGAIYQQVRAGRP